MKVAKVSGKKKNNQSNIDIEAVKTVLKSANDYVTNLWKRSNIPTEEIGQEDDSTHDSSDSDSSSEPVASQHKPFGNEARAKSLQELHKKLEVLKGEKRSSYRDEMNKKKLKNKISKKKQKEERALGKKMIRMKKAGIKVENVLDEKVVLETKPVKTDKAIPKKPIYNGEGKMVFSRFDFLQPSDVNQTKSNDAKQTLLKLEKRKEQLKELEMSGDRDKIKAVKESIAWDSVLQKSEGVKVKDDPKLLKQKIKKIAIRKTKSREAVAAREEATLKKVEAAQFKRRYNLEKRKKEKKTSKLRSAAKRGRNIPGF